MHQYHHRNHWSECGQALHFATPVATTPTPISLTNFTLTLVQLMVSFVEKTQDVSDDTKNKTSAREKKIMSLAVVEAENEPAYKRI